MIIYLRVFCFVYSVYLAFYSSHLLFMILYLLVFSYDTIANSLKLCIISINILHSVLNCFVDSYFNIVHLYKIIYFFTAMEGAPNPRPFSANLEPADFGKLL